MAERGSRIGQFFQELGPAIRDSALEPIRFSQALKEKLTDVTKIPDYDNLSRATKAAIQVRGYMWGYLPIEMPIAMASGLVMQGNVLGGLLVGGGAWMFEGAMLKYANVRGQTPS